KPLNAIATTYLTAGGNRDDLYYEASKASSDLDRLAVPSSMLKLAKIRPFRLYLSTTFDSLMKRALDEVRYHGDDLTLQKAVTRWGTEDTSEELVQRRIAAVFHLFGRAVPRPD